VILRFELEVKKSGKIPHRLKEAIYEKFKEMEV
jgi:hypothetical protein